MHMRAELFFFLGLMPGALGAIRHQHVGTRAATPSPVPVSASQAFEGVDGPWSTFELRVGNPAQNVRVLPGTSSTQTLVVLPVGCQIINVTDCPKSRGGLFNSSASQTWQAIGTFNLGFESSLGFKDNGLFGYDSVGVGFLGSGGPVIDHSIVAGVAGTEFYLGVLGLNPLPTNFTDQNDPQPSFMQLLKNQSQIPSLSYGYTAGAPYRLNKALGSLILGGYDTSFFQDTKLSHKFFSDQSRDLTVGVQSITTNASTANRALQSTPIPMFIDSSVTEIYLPLDACRAFEQAFNLTYNNATQRYLVDDSLHNRLVAANPSVTFTIATAITGGDSWNVTFPYASFDLQVTPPLVQNASRYFPLRRAANASQYTLGRVFLQETYLIVDYERGNFSLHPKVWNASAVPNLVTIQSLTTVQPVASQGLGGGAIAGIVLGVLLFIGAIATAILRYLVVIPRRKAAKAAAELEGSTPTSEAQPSPEESTAPVVEARSDSIRELEADEAKLTPEIEGSVPTTRTPMSELESAASPRLSELPSPAPISELPSPGPLSELPSPAPVSELLSREIYEMPGSDVPELPGSPGVRS